MTLSETSITEYNNRREKIFRNIRSDEVAVLQGLPQTKGHELFIQSSNFFYLCGIESPHSYLLLEGKTKTTILFLMRPGKAYIENVGDLLSPDNADPDALGVDEVRGIEALSEYLEPASKIWTLMREDEGPGVSWDNLRREHSFTNSDPWDGRPNRTSNFITLLRARYPEKEILNLNPTLDELRLIKSPYEVELMRRAGKITAQSVIEAICCIQPGLKEYHLEAVMRYVFLAAGSHDVGYRAIIATGQNAWHGHYSANTSTMNNGELVLVDGAPDYFNYTSDIGRMMPVSGTYTAQQRELYGFVVEYHKVLLGCLRPGISSDQVLTEARTIMMEKVEKTDYSKDIYRESIINCLNRKSHLSHPVGLSCHDVGEYKNGKPLRPGMVFSVDPILLVPQEKIYVRIEDTVLITAEGIENFTVDAPTELDDVEELMKKSGIIENFPPVF